MLAEVSGVELRVPRDNHARSRVAGMIKKSCARGISLQLAC